MITGTTKSGFAFAIDDEAMDDYELIEAVVQVDKENYVFLPEIVDRILGKEQKEKLMEHIRAENGRVSARVLLDEVTEIFGATNETKN